MVSRCDIKLAASRHRASPGDDERSLCYRTTESKRSRWKRHRGQELDMCTRLLLEGVHGPSKARRLHYAIRQDDGEHTAIGQQVQITEEEQDRGVRGGHRASKIQFLENLRVHGSRQSRRPRVLPGSERRIGGEQSKAPPQRVYVGVRQRVSYCLEMTAVTLKGEVDTREV